MYRYLGHPKPTSTEGVPTSTSSTSSTSASLNILPVRMNSPDMLDLSTTPKYATDDAPWPHVADFSNVDLPRSSPRVSKGDLLKFKSKKRSTQPNQ